jgi:hypothetical protein
MLKAELTRMITDFTDICLRLAGCSLIVRRPLTGRAVPGQRQPEMTTGQAIHRSNADRSVGPVTDEILRATIRAFGLACFGNRQVYLRMRIPQVHSGHRAGQWDVRRPNFVPVLGVSRDQILIDRA